MPLFQAVVWIDHHSARVLQLDAQQVAVQKVQAHTDNTGQRRYFIKRDPPGRAPEVARRA